MAKPERHVFVCTQARPPGHPRGSCSEKGCQAVGEALWSEMEKSNLFGRIAVTTSGCLGPCDIGPNLLIYPEGVMYTGVTKEDVPEIIGSHLLGGKPVEHLLAPDDVWS
ncbi:MAG: (2Fe-2S) ferredoxin domain-containing protein [Pseudomonadota bacterium]